jgi:hypothetical protein
MSSAKRSNPPNPPPSGLTVDNIVEAPIVETEVSALSSELEEKQQSLEKLRLVNKELRQNIEGRKEWGDRVFYIILCWLVSVVAIVLCDGFTFRGFRLDDSVLIAFISTTTVNVLTLGYIVANYLFPKPK